MARFSAWSVGLLLALAGSQGAHALTYAAVTPDPHRRAVALDATGHAYFAYFPFAFGLLGAMAVLGLLARLAATEWRAVALRWPIAFLPPLAFAVQEHLERLSHNGTFPWHAVLDPTFAPGLLLQLPLGVIAYLVARALLRGADCAAELLRTSPPRAAARAVVPLAPVAIERAPDAVTARRRTTRGPPLSVAA